MAEQFLTLMADLDNASQAIMSEWVKNLHDAGFRGTQTPNLPFHISMATFPLEKEQEAVEVTRRAAGAFAQMPVHISHIGVFAPGKVLFGAPERNRELDLLHNACETDPDQQRLWTPHVTLLIDEPAVICEAMPVVLKSFCPFVGQITRLHLCAFWPTREILSVKLRRNR